MTSFGVHYRVLHMFQAGRSHLVFCEPKQEARWCHTRFLVCWKIHGLECYSGPHCAASYLSETTISAGSAAEQAAGNKSARYALLPAIPCLSPLPLKLLDL